MKYFILTIILMLQFSLLAKEDKIEVLIKKIKTQKDDTNKVNNLNEIIFYYSSININTASKYSEQAIKLATELNFKKGLGISYLNAGVISFENKSKNYEFLHKSIDVFKEIKDNKHEASAQFEISQLLYSEAKYRNCITSTKQVIFLLKDEKTSSITANSYDLMGACNGNLGNHPEALQNFILSQKLFDKLQDKERSGELNYNIGALYQMLDNHEKAEYYFTKLLRAAKETNNKGGLSLSYYSIGNLLLQQEKYKEALPNTLKALNLTSKNTKVDEDIFYLEAIYLDLAEIQFKLKNYTEAEKYYQIVLKSSTKNNFPHNAGIALFGMAEIEIQKKDYQSAKAKIEKCLLIFKENDTKEEISLCYSSLSDIAEKTGDPKQALSYYKMHIQFKDSIFNEDTKSKILQTQMQYDFDKKSIADSIHNKHIQKIKDAEIKVIHSNLKFVVFGLIGVALILVIVINRFRLSKKQKAIIEQQNSKILESINYSKQIQDALLPDVEEMQKNLKNLFVFNQPKDIVSGDFYWFKKIDDISVIACVDCTGHGVPGAFMSVLGSLIMNKIVSEETTSPSQIISDLNNEIIQLLRQQSGGEIQDGMDLSICILDHSKKTISFSGARNGITIVQNGEAKRFKADLMPVGGNYMKKGKPIERIFTTQTIEISSSDWIYMYTDGYLEQIGGVSKTPMNYKQYEQILIELSELNNSNDKMKYLKNELDQWKCDTERTDDVLIIGFQIPDTI